MQINPHFSSTACQRYLENALYPGSRSVVSGKRYYSPSQGRFLGRDTKDEKGGLNLYGFCLNNPINGWDYLGMYYTTEVKDGVTIVTVPVVFANGTTKGQRDEFMTVANLTWGGANDASDGRKVVINIVELSEQPKNSQAYNTVNILDQASDVRSNTIYRGADRAAVINLNKNAPNETNLIGHELGHVLGNQDHYEVLYGLPNGDEQYFPAGSVPAGAVEVKPSRDRPVAGWENNVMGASDMNRIDKRNIDEMLLQSSPSLLVPKRTVQPGNLIPGPSISLSEPFDPIDSNWAWQMVVAQTMRDADGYFGAANDAFAISVMAGVYRTRLH